MALLKVICWALIFIIRIRFQPGKSLATILNNQILQIFALMLQIFALLFVINCTEINQSQSSNIFMYIISDNYI